ncbi:gluconate 2-dehydrogenase subunit 3 family protein [Psychrobacillus sp. L3]|uniref:gluconate 2-dehydrogenase subunit 3 family protein n=1 Tax=Psychrobacillus sp. L3 TaxID=3236891 RepID=UPI0036F1C9E1
MVNNDNNKSNNPSANDENKVHDPGRRRFLKNTGMIVGGLAGGSLIGGVLTNQFQSKPSTILKDETSKMAFTEARMFFTRFTDFVVLEQATERIFPEDKNGPGAIKLGVPYFIDKQLAGPWGMNAKDYRHSPFDGSDAAAVNSRLTRGDIFLDGLRKMNELSQDRFNTTFDKIDADQQIEILGEFEKGNVKMNGVSSASFFELLRMSVLEGAYSDPLYGGNQNMAGWKMKEFPGPVASYGNIIESDEFVKMDPISLTNYQRKS